MFFGSVAMGTCFLLSAASQRRYPGKPARIKPWLHLHVSSAFFSTSGNMPVALIFAQQLTGYLQLGPLCVDRDWGDISFKG
jgi:ABC-type transport system involved in cytochrome c biogenesis permease subunit